MTDPNSKRHEFIGGSDARRILDGDWLNLWMEKTGRKAEENLDHVWKVQLGKFTEGFHFRWLMNEVGLNVKLPLKQQHSHDEFDFIRAQLDAIYDETFIELKHSNERANPRDTGAYYLPQLAHYCNVMAVDHCYMSVIPGNAEPFQFRVDVPADYAENLLNLECEFWEYVMRDTEPNNLGSITTVIEDTNEMGKAIKIDGFRKVDMEGNNEWALLAGVILETKEARDRHEHCKTEIKALVESDVGEASAYGVTIKRDKRGSLRINLNQGET